MHTRALGCPDPQARRWDGIPGALQSQHSKGKFLHFSSELEVLNSCGCTQMCVGMGVALTRVFWGVIPWKSPQQRWCLRSCCWYHCCACGPAVQLSWQTVSPCPESAPRAVCPQGHCPATCRAPNAQEYLSFLLKVTGYLLFHFHPK